MVRRDNERWKYVIQLDDKKIKCDGFCEETNTIYEYHGSFYHGCPLCFDPWKCNRVNKKKYGDLYLATKLREELIRKKGYNLVVKWECGHFDNLRRN